MTKLLKTLVSKKNNSNNIIIRFGSDSKELAKKLRKLKAQKLFKSQKLANLEKNCWKVGIYLILILKKINHVF